MCQILGFWETWHKKVIQDAKEVLRKEMFIHISIQEKKFTQVFG